MLDGLPRLRGFKVSQVLRRAFILGCGARKDADGNRSRFRICQFSIQGNHIHLVCEAADANALSRGVQGFKIRVTRALNKLWHRRGTVFADRYHAEIKKTPREVRTCVAYVIQNARKHGVALPQWTHGVDPFSSAWYFDGWSDERWRRGLSPPEALPDAPGPPVAEAHTWLLRKGWRRWGLVATDEVPAAAAEGRAR
jgi:REP element-mobilizing transposase RayT